MDIPRRRVARLRYLGEILPSVNPHPCFLDVLSPTPTGLPNYLQKLDKSKVRSVISARDDYFRNPLPGNDAAAIAPVAALQQIWTQQACADLDCIQSEGEGYFVVPACVEIKDGSRRRRGWAEVAATCPTDDLHRGQPILWPVD